ncbi:DsbA family protein [Temperatibacter marinus]|uniref:DsbA family protein n=1 Tax=Temperatibacter marinus TaxID=1456591 RepID=A0AA52EEH9_9PROT|nr:DsbA family protein [Temperatibacter marinus]WND01608.1 DsbA family protein [Temperatibacter marinus]
MSAGTSYKIYIDINCPFCFALNERLDNLASTIDEIEWRYIEHIPETDSIRVDPLDMVRLKEELIRLEPRAPDIRINNPGFRPNTSVIQCILAEIGRTDVSAAKRLRDIAYKALWQGGADISDISIIKEMMKRADCELPEISSETLTLMTEWKEEWLSDRIEARLPSIDQTGRPPLLGLPSTQDLVFFMLRLDAEEEKAKRREFSCTGSDS